MSDPWARATDADPRPPGPEVIEVDLVGEAGETGEPGDGIAGNTPPTNWRKVVALSSLAGIMLGAIVATVMIVGDDDGESSPTTLPRDELASVITTPPTLPPIDKVADDPEQFAVQAPEITLPDYPATFVGAGPGFERSAFTGPELDAPRVATVVSMSSDSAIPTESRIAYDPTNQRYELTVDLPVGSSKTIYDAGTGTIYEQYPSMEPEEAWRASEASRALAGISRTLGISVDEYFRQLVLGPVRADNVDEAISISSDDFTYEVLGQTTRRLVVRLPIQIVGFWQPAAGPDDQTVANYEVYVGEDGEVVRTQAVLSDADAVRSLQHSTAFPDGETIIELPDPDTIAGEAPSTPPTLSAGDGTAESLRPMYDELTDPSAIDQDQFDVDVAFDHLFSRPPAASIVDVVWADGHQLFASQRDDVNNRRSMLVTSVVSDDVTVQIDDGASATTLLTDDQRRNWTRLSNTGLGSRRLPVDERLISGPLTPATVEAAEIEPGRFVTLEDGTYALEVRLVVQPGDLALPSIVPMRLDAGEPVEVYVYVGAGVVHEIHVVSNVGAQIFAQVFDLRAEPVISLPDPSRIADG